jgi:HK97 family phage portal protein
MVEFQKNFFDNGAVLGTIIETDSILSKKLKDRQEIEWLRKFNPKKVGGGRPVILDGGMKAKQTGSSNLREMAFNESIKAMEEKVALALGVPPILLDGGNNANIKPNIELLFYLTIIPMLRKFVSGMEAFFAFDLELTTHKVPALTPDLKEQAERLSSLVNNGLMIGNEARAALRLDPIDDEVMKKIRIPANVAGSATGVSGQEGGKPATGDKT